MEIAIRHILIDQNDQVIRLNNSLFERLWKQSRNDTLAQFSGCRLRYAEIVVEIQDRKPVSILRVVFGYLYFDEEGRLDRDRIRQDAVLKMEASGIGAILSKSTERVIDASWRFAARRRDHEAVWRPDIKLKEAIYEAALDSKKYKRL